jgi:hypothetical protein
MNRMIRSPASMKEDSEESKEWFIESHDKLAEKRAQYRVLAEYINLNKLCLIEDSLKYLSTYTNFIANETLSSSAPAAVFGIITYIGRHSSLFFVCERSKPTKLQPDECARPVPYRGLNLLIHHLMNGTSTVIAVSRKPK